MVWIIGLEIVAPINANQSYFQVDLSKRDNNPVVMQQSDLTLALSLSASPQRKAGVIAQHVLEEMVLYDGNAEMGYTLNASARSIWDLCDGERSLAVICEEIALDLQIDTELLYDDVKMTVAELASLGLLSIPEEEGKAEINQITE